MLLRLHLLTLPKVFLLCLPKRASTAICPRLIQCCSTPVPAPFSYICCCVDRFRCHGLGRWQQRPKGPGEGTSAGVGVTARAMSLQRCDLAGDSQWAVLTVPLLIRLFSWLQFTSSIIQTENQNEGFFYPSTNSFTAHRTNVMPFSLTSAITTAGQTRFLHQPTECLWDSRPNSSPGDCILQWNRITQSRRWRNSNNAWKKRPINNNNTPITAECKTIERLYWWML